MADMNGVASFHLVSDRGPLRAFSRLALDRVRLRGVDGLVFWRLLGTGRGDETGPSADLRRTALFAVWRDADALAAFRSSDRWAAARESWHVTLAADPGRRTHGRWRGVDPTAGLVEGPAGGPVAVVTRAHVRPGSWREFRASSRLVADEVRAAAGLLDVVAIGEAPVGRLGTFSLWSDGPAIDTFVRSMPHHREAVRLTRQRGWYGEELFARFVPVASSGTWGGRDPLAGLLPSR